MKKFIICLLFSLNITWTFSQDFFLDRYGTDFNRALDFYNRSIYEFAGIFSSNALRILLGEIDLLNSRYSELDIFSLAQLNNQNLRLLRNMIYAKHGLIFNSPDLTTYFRKFNWYTPKHTNVDNLLTNIDRINIQKIQAYESRNENLPNIILNNPVGFWHDSPAVAAGYSEHFIIHPANRLEFYFSSMTNFPIASKLDGSYTIKGNVLTYSIAEISFDMNDSELRGYPWGDSWANYTGNKMTFENPIVFKIPISNIESFNYSSGDTIDSITIGGQRFFKFSNDVN
jgi:hypothetical protein